MFKDLRTLSEKAAKAEPWAAVAVVLAVLLVGYYLLIGARYWQASERAPELTNQFQNLTRTLRRAPVAGEDVYAQLAAKEIILETLNNTFHYPQSDDLVSIASEVARDTSIALLMVKVDIPREQLIGDISYQTQSLNLTVQGETKDLFKFIIQMHERVPVIRVTNLRMADLEDNPTAQIGFQALLDPREISVEEKK